LIVRYLLKKLAAAAATLFIVATLTFFLMKLLPGDPFSDEKKISPEIHRTLLVHYGLDKPLAEQYFRYMRSLLQGDLGLSFVYRGKRVNDVIREGFPVSFILGTEALLIAVASGLSLGALSALWKKSLFSRAILLAATLGISIPSFAIAAFLQYFAALKLGWFPVARWGTFSHTILPALSLAALPASFIARLTRAKMGEALEKSYIKTALAKGLSPAALLRKHLLKNSCIPLLAYLGQLSASIFVGSFVIERIFSIPGLGQWLIASVMGRDYTMVLGLSLFYSLVLVTMVALFDLAYCLADPRIRPWRAPCG